MENQGHHRRNHTQHPGALMSARGERFFAGNSEIQPLFAQGIAPFHGCVQEQQHGKYTKGVEKTAAVERVGTTGTTAGTTPSNETRSSRGLGLNPFTVDTRVRIAYGSPLSLHGGAS